MCIRDRDLAILVGLIEAVTGDVAVFVWHILAGAGRHFERDTFQRFTGEGIPLVDDERSCLRVGDDHRLGIAALPDEDVYKRQTLG